MVGNDSPIARCKYWDPGDAGRARLKSATTPCVFRLSYILLATYTWLGTTRSNGNLHYQPAKPSSSSSISILRDWDGPLCQLPSAIVSCSLSYRGASETCVIFVVGLAPSSYVSSTCPDALVGGNRGVYLRLTPDSSDCRPILLSHSYTSCVNSIPVAELVVIS